MSTATSEDLLPPIEKRREMLENGIANAKNQAWDLEIQIATVEAQTSPEDAKKRKLRDLRETRENSHRVVARLKRMLAELPEEPRTQEGGDG